MKKLPRSETNQERKHERKPSRDRSLQEIEAFLFILPPSAFIPAFIRALYGCDL
jgi:hypothetical protein